MGAQRQRLGVCVVAALGCAPAGTAFASETAASSAERASRRAAERRTAQAEAHARLVAELASTQELRSACKRTIAGERTAFASKQLARRRHFDEFLVKRLLTFREQPRNGNDRALFRARQLRQRRFFIVRQSRREERFDLSEEAAQADCLTLTAAGSSSTADNTGAGARLLLATAEEAEAPESDNLLMREG